MEKQGKIGFILASFTLLCCAVLGLTSIHESVCDHGDCALCTHTCNVALLWLPIVAIGLLCLGTVAFVSHQYKLQLAYNFFHPPKF